MKKRFVRKPTPYVVPVESPLHNMGVIVPDALGSYTGVPSYLDEFPVQDADDL